MKWKSIIEEKDDFNSALTGLPPTTDDAGNKATYDEQWERTYDGENAEEWMRRSDIDQQGENL